MSVDAPATPTSPHHLTDSQIKAEETAALSEELTRREGRLSTVEPRFERMQEGVNVACQGDGTT